MKELESKRAASQVNWEGRPVWAEIDLDALTSNVHSLQSLAGDAAIMAVVKANAYGHGIVPVARAALQAGARWLGVVCVDEGVRLRRSGIDAPVLVLGHIQAGEVNGIIENSLTPTINSLEIAHALSGAAREANTVLSVHIKVDTGLHRYGSIPRDAIALAQAVRSMHSLRLDGLFTHFSMAEDGENPYTEEQFRRFLTAAEQIPGISVRHVCNTAALLRAPHMALEIVRPGIGLYGCYPSPDLKDRLMLLPVLSLKSRIARLHRLQPGQGVSYGHTWRADRPTTLALVMCGYGDGLPRSLSNRGSVLIRGARAPIVGRICMDMCMVDVTDVPRVAEGDEVVIIGRQGNDEITADEVAELAGTISYEVLCHITERVPRLYMREGRLIEVETFLHEGKALR